MILMAAAGTSDFKLGAFQCILDQLFPGSIRTFATDPINQNAGPIGNEPTAQYYNSVFAGRIIQMVKELWYMPHLVIIIYLLNHH